MSNTQWSTFHRADDLQLSALHARFVTYAFARHWHDYYVIGLVDDGAQSFWWRRSTYLTPQDGLILLNPGEPHTGEAARAGGFFTYRALYPTRAHVAAVLEELGRPAEEPLFTTVRVDAHNLTVMVRHMHTLLDPATSPLERQTAWLNLMMTLVLQYSTSTARLPVAGREPRAIDRARAYLETHYAERISLATLADHVGLSPFHLVRVFRRATGMPPHAYLESIRIHHAQRHLSQGDAIAEVAYATGWSSQSHFTAKFRRIMGVTPGQYRRSC